MRRFQAQQGVKLEEWEKHWAVFSQKYGVCVCMLCEERMIYNDPFLNKMRAKSEDDDFSWKVGIVSDREGDVEMGQSGCG